MDSLTEMSRNDWPKLQTLFRKYWPQGIEGFRLLDVQLQYPNLIDAFNFKVYCPGGDVNNGMIAITDKGDYQVFIFPVSEDMSAIEAALINTKIIDWGRIVCTPAADSITLACLKRISDRLSLRITESRAYKHFLERGSKLLEITNSPENTYVGPLNLNYLDLVDRTWTFYTPDHSRRYFETLSKTGLIYVLYSSEDHKPICWMAVDEAGAFAHMYCLENHRKKGYAEYLTKYVTNNSLEQGKDVLAYTLEENEKPQKLFHKLGFDSLGVVTWVFLEKQSGL